jgi:hypothetical protein
MVPPVGIEPTPDDYKSTKDAFIDVERHVSLPAMYRYALKNQSFAIA